MGFQRGGSPPTTTESLYGLGWCGSSDIVEAPGFYGLTVLLLLACCFSNLHRIIFQLDSAVFGDAFDCDQGTMQHKI